MQSLNAYFMREVARSVWNIMDIRMRYYQQWLNHPVSHSHGRVRPRNPQSVIMPCADPNRDRKGGFMVAQLLDRAERPCGASL